MKVCRFRTLPDCCWLKFFKLEIKGTPVDRWLPAHRLLLSPGQFPSTAWEWYCPWDKFSWPKKLWTLSPTSFPGIDNPAHKFSADNYLYEGLVDQRKKFKIFNKLHSRKIKKSFLRYVWYCPKMHLWATTI